VKLSSAIATVFLLAAMSQAMAQVAPSMQEKMACRSDAESLCSQFVGKPPQMQACLRDNKAKLSVPCRKVVEAHGG
jgi:Cysteine rich repeat